MKLRTLLPPALHVARWWPKFAALVRRWSRSSRAGDLSDPARRLRFRPTCDALEERFQPGDPLGLQYAAFGGSGLGFLLANVSLTGSAKDPGLPSTAVTGAAASRALAFAAPDQPGSLALTPATDSSSTAPAAGSGSSGSTPAAPTSPSQPAVMDGIGDPLASAWAEALASSPATHPSADSGPAPTRGNGGSDAAATVSAASPSGPVAAGVSPSPSPAGASAPGIPPLPPDVSRPAASPLGARTAPGTAVSPALAPAATTSASAPAAPAPTPTRPTSAATEPPGHPNLVPDFASKVPLAFEPNVGQTDSRVQFLSRGPGYALFLTGDSAVLRLARPGSPGASDVLKEQFVGADPAAPVVGEQPLSSRSNYFTGTDPSAWHPDVAQYAQVRYRNLYPGIDALYYGNSQRQLEYDLTVAPGADPGAIRMSVQGSTGLQFDSQGNLLLQTAGGTVVQQAPTLYQTRDGARQPVSGRYTLTAGGAVGFQPGSYDPTLPLVIDPTLNFGSYLGGGSNDYAYGVAVDPAGNVYLTGQTLSSNFPVTTGGTLGMPSDAFVTKFYASGGALIYSTYLGGSGSDQANAIAVDAAGNAYVTGQAATSFPTTAGAYQTGGGTGMTNGFVTELNITGDALLYSSYFCSTSMMASGAGDGIAVDAAGNAYVTGYTSTATGFPTTSGAYQTTGGGGNDAWVAKFNPAASGSSSLVYATLLGGSADDQGNAIAVDGAGDAYVTGSTGNPSGTAFPTTTGAYQTSFGLGTTKGFVTEVNPSGSSLVYSTYLGGTSADQGNAIAVNLAGNAYVTGTATSTNFPTTTGAYQTTAGGGNDAFATELNTTGTGLAYSTYLGGSGNDEGNGIAVDGSGYAVVAGETASTNFPTASALQSSNGGGNDAFLTRLNPAGTALSYSTYLGGSSGDAAQAVALDLAGNAYVAGWTNSSNFPTAGSPYQSSNAGSTDAFVAKVGAVPNPPVFTSISPDTGTSSSDQITTSRNLTLSGTAAPGATVTVSRSGVGVLGSVTANATTGAWTYDYSGTTLPEGTQAFTGTTTVNGLTSPPSPPFLVTVDLTAPALTVTAPASTASLGPQVLVTAGDLNGLPDGTTVTLDVDTNDDGNFTDSGETGYATGRLKDGSVSIALPQLPATGTYPIRARVTDLAGNQATSSTQNIVVTSATA